MKLKSLIFLVLLVIPALVIATKPPSGWQPMLVRLDEDEFGKVYADPSTDLDYVRGTYLATYESRILGLDYKNVDDEDSFNLKIDGPYVDEFAGFEVNGLKYAIHLIYCDSNSGTTKRCSFRINGIPIGQLHDLSVSGQNIFVINDEVEMEMK